ncbi:hypothetical protein [Lentilitoribacter sp. Alg239-R112]|uniref:hypothetical protein n=1 Tax=Lentilitoribacter sp. Alg239-R112 TaxID=2305987 RepID=UPI0013A69D18|nr:hypothetical protein [Lentilitoribacter sp. Alg239-R112]
MSGAQEIWDMAEATAQRMIDEKNGKMPPKLQRALDQFTQNRIAELEGAEKALAVVMDQLLKTTTEYEKLGGDNELVAINMKLSDSFKSKYRGINNG